MTAVGGPNPLAITKFPPGSGPRQLVHDGDATYVLGELSSAVYRLSGPRDALRVHDQVSATSATVPSFPAQLHLDAASRLLLVTNRGADTVAIFSADDFTRVAEIDCGGRTPRHLAQDGGLFFVSNQDSDEVCVFAMDDASRQLALVATHSVRSPSCVVTRGFAG